MNQTEDTLTDNPVDQRRALVQSLSDKLAGLRNKLQEAKDSAAKRNEVVAIPGEEILHTDPASLRTDELEQFVQTLRTVEQNISGEAGKQMLRDSGEMIGMVAGFSLLGHNAGALPDRLQGLLTTESVLARQAGIGNMHGASHADDHFAELSKEMRDLGRDHEHRMKAAAAMLSFDK